jgi:hypothetical protein
VEALLPSDQYLFAFEEVYLRNLFCNKGSSNSSKKLSTLVYIMVFPSEKTMM